MNIEQQAQQAYNSSKAMEADFGNKAANYTNAYNDASTSANNAQNDLTSFKNNMVSGNDTYQQQLALANQNSGYNVNDLNAAQNQVSQITGILGGLPRAIQASNANYGATAGDVANQYATTGANLNQTLGLSNQNAANQIAKMNAGLTGAQQGTGAVLQAQDQKRQAYEAAAQNAVNIMSQAKDTMNAYNQLYQQQGSITAQQQQMYAQARASYSAAQASLADAQKAIAQAHLAEQAYQYNADQRAWYDANGLSPTGQTSPNSAYSSDGSYKPGYSTQNINGVSTAVPNF